MALKIDPDQCVDCAACVEPCPNQAIRPGDEEHTVNGEVRTALSDKFYVIPELCTQCVGYYATPQCVAACPVDCIAPDPTRDETSAQLEAKARELKLGE